MLARGLESVMLAGVLAVVGCSGSGSAADAGTPGTGGTGGAAGGTAGSGAGGSGAGGTSSINPAAFLGTWNETVTFTASGTCAVAGSATESGPFTVRTGNGSDLETESNLDPTCTLSLDIVSPTQASLRRAKQCAGGSGSTAFTVTYDTWTLTVSGTTGTESASGTLSIASCPVSVTGTLTR